MKQRIIFMLQGPKEYPEKKMVPQPVFFENLV